MARRFFAIEGDALDGHDYATAAVAAGAALLVVAEAKLPALGKLKAPMIVVDDVLAAMTRLGIASRERSHAQIIAVTGSVGKTTTKEALRHVLSEVGKVSCLRLHRLIIKLGRAPDACTHAAGHGLRRLRNGNEPCR